MEEKETLKDVLDSVGVYSGLTTGTSMRPIIHQNRDTIIVAKPEGRLNKYDVPLYYAPGGEKYIMHRIIEVYDDHYICMGDNVAFKERVTDDMIVGKLIGYYRKGKTYIDLENNKAYKLYVKIWMKLIPIRPFTMFVNKCFAKLESIFCKRG